LRADPDAKELDFEICSWLINGCKNNFTPDKFIGICRKVVEYCSASPTKGRRQLTQKLLDKAIRGR
jgi:hypothetical protein